MKAKDLIKILEKTPNHEVVIFVGIDDEYMKFNSVGGVERMMALKPNGKKARTVLLYQSKDSKELKLKPVK